MEWAKRFPYIHQRTSFQRIKTIMKESHNPKITRPNFAKNRHNTWTGTLSTKIQMTFKPMKSCSTSPVITERKCKPQTPPYNPHPAPRFVKIKTFDNKQTLARMQSNRNTQTQWMERREKPAPWKQWGRTWEVRPLPLRLETPALPLGIPKGTRTHGVGSDNQSQDVHHSTLPKTSNLATTQVSL